jgi:hypothetical protein
MIKFDSKVNDTHEFYGPLSIGVSMVVEIGMDKVLTVIEIKRWL